MVNKLLAVKLFYLALSMHLVQWQLVGKVGGGGWMKIMFVVENYVFKNELMFYKPSSI